MDKLNLQPKPSILTVQHDHNYAKVPNEDENACLFCQADHSNLDCPLHFMRKIRILDKKGRCYKCFSQQHFYSQCFNKKNCELCNKEHDKTLCILYNVKFPV